MMEILKRFEEDDLNNNALLEEENSDDDDLVKRFEGVDIEAASPDKLWALLKPEERDKFIKALNDSSGELAQQLLASEELYHNQRRPWWEDPTETNYKNELIERVGEQPEMMSIPSSMVKSVPSGPSLIYNLVAICVAYAFVTRQFAISPLSSIETSSEDYTEVKHQIAHLVPFLTDRKATTLHSSVSSAVTDIRSRFEESTTSSTFSLLLRDTSKLVRPLPVAVVAAEVTSHAESFDTFSHPNRSAVLVLSDLYKLFETQNGKSRHVAQKLIFYAAHVLSTPSMVLTSLSKDIYDRSSIPPDSTPAPSDIEPRRPQNFGIVQKEGSRSGLIEEL
ncbi:hypothetical protein D9758_006058 [Tetrapyrgos nigripes]|uniref:Uncharacterized protein n=1 Tax=Tetrapyrgos nigripes TaxID=182062 RepID=A0A8H5D9S4_9AGAR|nr:hypothetical protein D9758_006058 [Tetrapyrgos nigripes]